MRGPGLAAALEQAEGLATEGQPVEVWCNATDRLARGEVAGSGQHLLELIIWAASAGIKIRTVAEGFNSADGDMALIMGALHGAGATAYSKNLSKRVKGAKERQFQEGRVLGGPVPDGLLRKVERNESGAIIGRHYVRDPDRAPVIEEIFAWAEQGIGDPTIASRLNKRGVRTNSGNPWTRRTIQDKIMNPIYGGWVARFRGTDKEERTKATNVEALIDPARYDAIRGKRASRDRAKDVRSQGLAGKGKTTKRYALSRLAVCAKCGESMYCRTDPYKRKDGTQARNYVCKNVVGETGLCDAGKVNAELVDAALIPHLEQWLTDFATWSKSIRDAASTELATVRADEEKVKTEVTRLEKVVEKAERQYADALSNGEDDKAEAISNAMAGYVKQRKTLAERSRVLSLAADKLAKQGQPTDAMLKYWFDFADSVRGRVSGSTSMEDVNAELRVALTHVELEHVGGIDELEIELYAGNDPESQQYYRNLEMEYEAVVIKPYSAMGKELETVTQYVRYPVYDPDSDSDKPVRWVKPPIMGPSDVQTPEGEGSLLIHNPGRPMRPRNLDSEAEANEPEPSFSENDSHNWFPQKVEVPILIIPVIRTPWKRVVVPFETPNFEPFSSTNEMNPLSDRTDTIWA